MSDTDTDVYNSEVWFIFCTVYVCFVFSPNDVHLHVYAKYILQVDDIITAHVRPIRTHPPPNTKMVL